MTATVSITKRRRKRCLKSGLLVVQTRYVVNYVRLSTGRRAQLFFERHSDAVAKRNDLVSDIAAGIHAPRYSEVSVSQAVERWLHNRKQGVKPGSWRGYKQIAGYIIGPLLRGTSLQRRKAALNRLAPNDATYLEMLGPMCVSALSTADIRQWHDTVAANVGAHTANAARKALRAALALVAEDFNMRIPLMPSRLGRGRSRTKKAVLTTGQIARLMKGALEDERKGIYYAFPFLTGVRPSEQLSLLWEDIDAELGVIRICRMQEQDGSITPYTKTAAGTREIPVCPFLRIMLLRWRDACPTTDGRPFRVFPRLGGGSGLSTSQRWKGGGALTYANFRVSYWRPALLALGLPYVTPHSARHSYISTLQAQGIEVGLVAKLAGHASAAVTLSHYTQAIRGGEIAVQALQDAFCLQGST